MLIELAQVLGEWRDAFVIVGGAVPWLLLDTASPRHIGTLDIDLDLDPDVLAEGAYADLVHTLEHKGYERTQAGLKPFQLRRTFRLDDGQPVSVLVDLLMPRNEKGGRKGKKLICNRWPRQEEGRIRHLFFDTKLRRRPGCTCA